MMKRTGLLNLMLAANACLLGLVILILAGGTPLFATRAEAAGPTPPNASAQRSTMIRELKQMRAAMAKSMDAQRKWLERSAKAAPSSKQTSAASESSPELRELIRLFQTGRAKVIVTNLDELNRVAGG